MRFDRVRLENFKCYADADLHLDAGVTVIHGLNGSGKSSLLEACFFALYGATALEKTLEEVVTIGAEDATVELWFSHGGASYHLERRIRATGDQPQTATCVLETPGGTVDGVRDVEAHVAELLRMDDDAFVNCAYVRQGEVNKLINATATERQDMIDDLLQLGRLETYRSRASDARLGVREVRQTVDAQLEQLDEQIDEKEGQELHDRLNGLRTELNEVAETIERFESNRQAATESLAETESAIAEYEAKREELDDVTERIADLREKIAETERERASLTESVHEGRERLSELDDRIDETLAGTDLGEADPDAVTARLDALADERETVEESIQAHIRTVSDLRNEAERHEERAEERSERATTAREEADDLEADAAEIESSVDDARETIESIETEIAEKRAAFEDAPVAFGESDAHLESLRADLDDLRERETELRESLATARSRVEEGEALLAEGKCPECGQPVEGSPHVDSLSEHRERVAALEADLDDLADEKDELETRLRRAEELVELESETEADETRAASAIELLSEREQNSREKREQAETRRETAAELDEEAATAAAEAAATRERAAEQRREIGELNQRKQRLADRLDRLSDLASAIDERADQREEVERLRERRSDLADHNDERREHLAAARERKQTIAADYDDAGIEDAREERDRAEQYLEHVDSKLDELAERRDELQGQVGAVENAIEELETLRARREQVAERAALLASLHEETETLEAMYGDLRAELRQRNVETLERLVNEVFDLVYQNDSYAHIDLSGDYELTVYQKDGEPLDPEQLSGGERALFNLSLRCAIYRLLAEGIEGSAPMPPLILDEPTVFLDAGHVSRLVELIESMRQLGVEQIVVVSHDDELVGAADDLVRVEKDATSNRSTVERVGTLAN